MARRLHSRASSVLVTITTIAVTSLVAGGNAERVAQEGANGSTSAGVFTEEQAQRGKDLYDQECTLCHLDDLRGDGISPSLLGRAFTYRWGDLSIGDMYTAIRTTMPEGAPASLSAQSYVDIIAYLLHANEFPSGDTELSTDEDVIQQIIIDD